jgi:hypothetical protein
LWKTTSGAVGKRQERIIAAAGRIMPKVHTNNKKKILAKSEPLNK